MQTIYRLATPEAIHSPQVPGDFHPGEYRQLLIRQNADNPSGKWTLYVNQGWHYEDVKQALHPRNLITEHFATFPEADSAYKSQLKSIKALGFVHSFTPAYIGP